MKQLRANLYEYFAVHYAAKAPPWDIIWGAARTHNCLTFTVHMAYNEWAMLNGHPVYRPVKLASL